MQVFDYLRNNLNDRYVNNKGLQLISQLEQLLIEDLHGNEVEVACLMESEAYYICKKVICSDSLLADFINLAALINVFNVESITALANELKKGDLMHMWSLVLNFLELIRII